MRVIAIIAAFLLLAGCGGSNQTADTKLPSAPTTSTAAPTLTAPPVAQRYPTVEALKDAALAAGLSCPSWVQDNVVQAAAESGTCSDDTVLSTYATDADLQFALENLQGMNEMMKEKNVPVGPQLIGANWIINAPGADGLASKLGGTVER
ncbi:hypothetical protein PWY87_34125 [Kribbella solani]|uniref:hypothetical protein n=1 Tax=Kribbella solani TaxID=236067 RepID=UPI0029A2EFA7|nr:hypothetical protein [Kribbella solani]MDX3006755.1 hypothetical protein [Kribbella solani]